MLKTVIAIATLALLCGCNQNIELVSNGETLDSAAKPVVDPNARPLASADGRGAPAGGRRGGMPNPEEMMGKAYLMHNFVEALYSAPKNGNPNPKWESPLKNPGNGRVRCSDCHISSTMNFDNFPNQRVDMVDKFEGDKAFMVDLMKKWVAKLNNDEFGAKDKLKGPVTCLTCHATNPAD
jgi:hypothetical protein